MEQWDRQILNSIFQSDFIVALVIIEHISGLMLPTTRNRQMVCVDLVEAMQGVGDLISSPRNMREEAQFAKLFKEATEVASALLGINLTKPWTAARSKYRPSASLAHTVEDFYRVNVFYPTSDNILHDLDLRIGVKTDGYLLYIINSGVICDNNVFCSSDAVQMNPAYKPGAATDHTLDTLILQWLINSCDHNGDHEHRYELTVRKCFSSVSDD